MREKKMEETRYRKRQDEVWIRILYRDKEENFYIEKRVAIPLMEALRTYQRMKDVPDSVSTDTSAAAQILLALSGIPY